MNGVQLVNLVNRYPTISTSLNIIHNIHESITKLENTNVVNVIDAIIKSFKNNHWDLGCHFVPNNIYINDKDFNITVLNFTTYNPEDLDDYDTLIYLLRKELFEILEEHKLATGVIKGVYGCSQINIFVAIAELQNDKYNDDIFEANHIVDSKLSERLEQFETLSITTNYK